ncbi:MAG: type II secretion system GspH family protein [Oscillospiraceae bacterium]|jgi:type IV pilus assembly protein PilA|nr:type II secretion system GspH family protein [Oscillospiraceae bacterium]
MKKFLSKSRKGFTLVELIVVIAIIAVLASILVPLMGGYLNDANRQSNALTAKNAGTMISAAVTSASQKGGTVTALVSNTPKASNTTITLENGATAVSIASIANLTKGSLFAAAQSATDVLSGTTVYTLQVWYSPSAIITLAGTDVATSTTIGYWTNGSRTQTQIT